jgi:hypothetical protein
VPSVTVKIDVNRAKAFDELGECVADISEILEMIPAHAQHEAIPIAQRIADRLVSWVKIGEKREGRK